MKIIVTGANGFLGSMLLKELQSKDILIYAVVKNEKENIDNIRNLSGVRIIYCDLDHIRWLPELINDRDIDMCIHLAWAGSFGDARADYQLQLTNIDYSMKLVDVLASMGVKRFVGAGTLAEKDVLNYHLTDGATPNPVSIYGIAKLTMNFMTKVECTKCNMEHVWCCISNTYGVGNTTNNFVNMASRKMLRGEHAAFTSGEQIYDFVYVTDTVKALCAAAINGKPNTSYYLGSTKPRRLKEYIKIIRDAIDPSIELFLGEIPFHGNFLPIEEYDASKLVTDTGFKPLISFEEGIYDTIAYLKEQEKLVEGRNR